MVAVKPPMECLVCLNSIETTFVSTEESQKIFNICCSYVKDAINIEFLINNINGNNNQLSFCTNCLNSSLNISELVEQLSKLKKEINGLVSCFTETIGKQRIQAKANNPTAIQYENGNCKKFQTPNQQSRGDLDSSDMLLLHTKQSETGQDSFMHLEASNELIGEQIAIDEINREIVKTECDEIYPDYEEERFSNNESSYKEGDIAPNCLVTGNENEIDPLGEDEETEIDVNNFCNIEIETKPQLFSSVTMPDVVLNRIPSDVISTRSGTSNSNKAFKDEDGSIPGGSDQKCNSTTKTTNVKQNASNNTRKKKKYNCPICLKSFSKLDNLKRHNFTHTGEKPFKCSLCQRSFNRSDRLKSHQRIHSEDRPVLPYKCSFCEKSFTFHVGLKHHERSHEETFKCIHCELTFQHRAARLAHQNNCYPLT